MTSIARAAEARREAQKLWNGAVAELEDFIAEEIVKDSGRQNRRLAKLLTVKITQRELLAASDIG